MPSQALIAFIQQSLPVSLEKITEIAQQFQPIEIKKNDYFLRQGRQGDKYLFLEKGMIRAFTNDQDGNETTTEFYSANQVVFEVASFFQKQPSPENLQALEDCVGEFITFDRVQYLFHSLPEFREFGRMLLVKGFITFKQRTLSLISETAEQRYRRLLNTRPDIFQKVPLKFIASYLGVTDSSLSRIRKELSTR
jgi:CRP-like cAMP-binding protein